MSEANDLSSLAKLLLTPALVATGACAMTTQYVCAALVIAAAERGAIDPERVFQLLAILADGFDQSPDIESAVMVANMLRGVRATFDNLTKIPAGAGHA